MKVLIAIALVSVASAVPRPEHPVSIDFRPLFVPKEVMDAVEAINNEALIHQNDAGIAINVVDSAINAEVAASNQLVASPINEEVNSDDGIAVKFVDSPKDKVDDLSALQFVKNNEENVAGDVGSAINFVDFADNVEIPVHDSSSAVNVVDSLILRDGDFAENMLNSPVANNGGSSVNIVDYPIARDGDAAENFVDSPIDDISVIYGIHNFVGAPNQAEVADIILISNIFEPISASELQNIRIVNTPVDFNQYPSKIYNNPLLR